MLVERVGLVSGWLSGFEKVKIESKKLLKQFCLYSIEVKTENKHVLFREIKSQ